MGPFCQCSLIEGLPKMTLRSGTRFSPQASGVYSQTAHPADFGRARNSPSAGSKHGSLVSPIPISEVWQ